MDALTHIVLGAAVAQLPAESKQEIALKTGTKFSWQRRALLGAAAAMFPDIDYVLFWVNPLDFIAYWHRAETHSIILAPIWAFLIAGAVRFFFRSHKHFSIFFMVCLYAVLSHTLLDSLTTFGTQWFAPFSRYRVSWNLIFVVDIYFTFCVSILFLSLIYWRENGFKYLAACLPIGYLLFLITIKVYGYKKIQQVLPQTPMSQAKLVLLPQPFSPFFWQVIGASSQATNQAYLKLAHDPIGDWMASQLGLDNQSASFQTATKLKWQQHSLIPIDAKWQSEARQVWSHPEFSAFRYFAQFPVLFEYQQLAQGRCIWFSDLRYHYPNMLPSFRYGMCKKSDQGLRLYRYQYLSRKQLERVAIVKQN